MSVNVNTDYEDPGGLGGGGVWGWGEGVVVGVVGGGG